MRPFEKSVTELRDAGWLIYKVFWSLLFIIMCFSTSSICIFVFFYAFFEKPGVFPVVYLLLGVITVFLQAGIYIMLDHTLGLKMAFYSALGRKNLYRLKTPLMLVLGLWGVFLFSAAFLLAFNT